MTFDEFNKHMHEITVAYGGMARWNQSLRRALDEARNLAEMYRDALAEDQRAAVKDGLPWEEGCECLSEKQW